MRRALLRVYALAFGLLLALTGLELAVRLLPVSDALRTQPVNAENPILHFAPNRVVHVTRGWNGRVGATKRVNNLGFLSDVDYDRDTSTPRAVVIGDSYVEAVQVENARTIHGLLNAAVAPRGAVYGIGASGSPLSQYLAFADYAVRSLGPRALVFVIVSNDFDESLLEYKQAPAFHYFAASGPDYELVRIDHAPSWIGRIAQHSALARYLTINLNAWARLAARLAPPAAAGGAPSFVANVPRQVSPARLSGSKRAVDFFLRELKARAPDTPALFVVDGIRPDLYSSAALAAARGSYFDLMRTHFIEQATKLGYEVIDLEPVFEADYAVHRTRLEFATDAHWNERGHRLAAEQVLRSATFRRALELD